LVILNNTDDELRYPTLFRVHHATTYFQEEEKKWYEQVKLGINDDWSCFCKKLKQYVPSRLKSINDYLGQDRLPQSLHEMSHFEQIIHNKFIKYSGKGDLEKWLLQTVNQFKQYQLSCSDQLRVIPLLLEDSA